MAEVAPQMEAPDIAALKSEMFSHLDLKLDDLTVLTDLDVDINELFHDMDKKEFQEDEMVRKALQQGTDLKKYSKEIEAKLRDAERDSINDYIKESDNLAHLHSQIRECDDILERTETMLGGFQDNLATISSEIRHLQDESLQMTLRLENRKQAEARLGRFITDIALPPDMIKHICEDEVNDSYLEYLLAFDKKVGFVSSAEAAGTEAKRDLEPEIEKLRVRATNRVGEFLLSRIQSLKKPKTNIQILQDNIVHKHKYLYIFLSRHGKDIAEQVRSVYSATMQKLYLDTFKAGVADHQKLQADIATSDDMIGTEEGKPQGGFAAMFGMGGKPVRNRQPVFAVGSRVKVLSDSFELIVPGAALLAKQKFPFEALYRCLNMLLIDTVSTEDRFVREFFGQPALLPEIFQRSLEHYLDTLQAYLIGCYDVTACLLLARIIQKQRAPLADRFPILANYLVTAFDMCSRRFQAVVTMHLQSLQRADAPSLCSSKTPPHPHYMSRRFAELTSAFILLNQPPDPLVMDAIGALYREMDRLIRAMAQQQPGKLSLVFLINNFDLIITYWHDLRQEHNIGLKMDEMESLAASLKTAIKSYVEEELKEKFDRLIAFLNESRVKLDASNGDPSSINRDHFEKHRRDFSARWKAGVESIHNSIFSFFTNFKNGQQILQAVLSRLVKYHGRFVDLWKKVFGDNNPPDFPNRQNVAYEMKRMSRNDFS
eukprot:gnl/Hemi2/908_TR322_c0_g1_i1.p1 gnl/Hemi2/908_TR322_c0_g1~~gnl/Hemi2/908_TR322_c0_g1_i1.p1  ORF type:complete len:714 (-),score=237.10 gnl/Hemi2/908_TR322_c0_g1_i1:216-2357(-)